MVHVDTLSRGPVQSVEVTPVNVSEEDWILSAQLQDEFCRKLIETLSRTTNIPAILLLNKRTTIPQN